MHIDLINILYIFKESTFMEILTFITYTTLVLEKISTKIVGNKLLFQEINRVFLIISQRCHQSFVVSSWAVSNTSLIC